MSLESKIETLTASIDRLSNLLEKLGSVDPAEVIKKEAEILREEAKAEAKQVETKAPEKQPEQTTPTAEALQAKCMELVRADRKNKQVIKDLLAGYSASLISDLDEAQRAELAVKLGAL